MGMRFRESAPTGIVLTSTFSTETEKENLTRVTFMSMQFKGTIDMTDKIQGKDMEQPANIKTQCFFTFL